MTSAETATPVFELFSPDGSRRGSVCTSTGHAELPEACRGARILPFKQQGGGA